MLRGMTENAVELRGTELLGIPVPISQIDSSLAGLFTPEEDGEEIDQGVTRASLLNLALYSERPENLAENAASIAEITREAACRSILICVDPTQQNASAESWIQAHCQLDPGGSKSICSEQISFVLRGRSPGMVRNTVFSHLDSDLPLVFWWRGEFSDAFEDRLYSRIDRLIFDSATWQNPRNQLVRLDEARRSGYGNFCLHDLAFTRLNSYRQAVSNAFDLPVLREAIVGIEGVKVRYPAPAKMSAMYLGAWIAAKLDAEFDRGYSTNRQFVFRSKNPEFPPQIFVELNEVQEPGAALAAAIKTGTRIIEWSRCTNRDYLRTRILREGTSPCNVLSEDWLPVRRKSDAELVTEILERGGRNRSLPSVLQTAAAMLTI